MVSRRAYSRLLSANAFASKAAARQCVLPGTVRHRPGRLAPKQAMPAPRLPRRLRTGGGVWMVLAAPYLLRLEGRRRRAGLAAPRHGRRAFQPRRPATRDVIRVDSLSTTTFVPVLKQVVTSPGTAT